MKAARLIGVFLLGLLVASLPLAPVVFPVEVYAAWSKLRHEPSAGGLVMTLEPAGPGEGEAGRGTWARVVFTNVGRETVAMSMTEVAGGELRFHAADRDGAKVPPGPLGMPEHEGEMSWVRQHRIPAGGRLGLLVDLTRWLSFPGPGLYALRGDRAPVQDKIRCRSNTVLIRVER